MKVEGLAAIVLLLAALTALVHIAFAIGVYRDCESRRVNNFRV